MGYKEKEKETLEITTRGKHMGYHVPKQYK
jgi:hypothetical protein